MRILTVCTGNICRSPTAEGVLRHLAPDDWLIDSCGMCDYHIGDAPDERAIAEALQHGVDIKNLQARQIAPDDFYNFDLLLAMDSGHLAQLQDMCPADADCKIALFMDDVAASMEVPDPYYGSQKDFAEVYDMIVKGAEAWVKSLGKNNG